MRRRLVELARQALRAVGYEIQEAGLAEQRRAFEAVLPDWIRFHGTDSVIESPAALGVIFSKDRALQLHALLESWFAQVDGTARLVVLWTATAAHLDSYAQLQALWGDRVAWLKESDFRKDLLNFLGSGQESHLFFLTDDAVVLRPFPLAEAMRPKPRQEIFALTHGPELDWCFIESRSQPVPPLEAQENGLLAWRWADCDPRLDWGFPLSVDGKFFAREEMLLLLAALPFRSPNTLEVAMQVYRPLFVGRRGICFDAACVVNVPCNAVQSEFANAITSRHSTQELLEQWNRGQRIAWEELRGKTPREAEAADYRFVSRL